MWLSCNLDGQLHYNIVQQQLKWEYHIIFSLPYDSKSSNDTNNSKWIDLTKLHHFLFFIPSMTSRKNELNDTWKKKEAPHRNSSCWSKWRDKKENYKERNHIRKKLIVRIEAGLTDMAYHQKTNRTIRDFNITE